MCVITTSPDQRAGARQLKVRIHSKASVDENGAVPALDHHGVQGPVERVLGQVHIFEPLRALGLLDVVAKHLRGERKDAVADDKHVDVADLQGITGRDQLVES
jgi:hypothetical protein